MTLKKLFSRYMKPVGEADGGGGTTDRGDSFVPTGADAEGAQDALSVAEREAEARATAEAEAAAKKKPDAAAGDADADLDPEDPDADADDKAKPKGKDSRIPLSRHKDILARERAAREAAEERLSNYEKGQQVAAISDDITVLENTVLGLEKQYTALLAEGEIDKATDKMREIRTAERQINDAKNDYRTSIAIAQATEQARYDVALERIEDAYPQINQDHDDFDKAVLGEVVEWKIFYEKQRNMTPTKALQAAVKKIMGTDTKAQERAATVAPKVDAEEVAKDVAKDRKAAAVKKNVDASAKTPASTAKVGMDSDKAGGALSAKDVMKMSQDDFKKLPDDVLARMRGDTFA
jgi:hypothetical protein